MTRELQPEEHTLAATLELLGGRALRADELERLLVVVVRVCDTMSSHGRGLIGCDLQPHNVLIGSRGQVHVTQECGRGAAAYMAPEQAWGRRADLDARTDVYGIGGLLYAILTRVAPHDGGSAGADLALARGGTVCAPQLACPQRSMPPGLCRIALRALSANPSERHPTVEILKQDIERFLNRHRLAQQVSSLDKRVGTCPC